MIALMGSLMMACQVIPESERLIPVNPEPQENKRGVLLVEFTGILCKNCPLAAEEANELQKVYGKNLVVVAMHPGTNDFTHTINPDWDFTCPESDVYYLHFGGNSTTPFPTGVINMDATAGMITYDKWAAEIDKSLRQEPQVGVEMAATLADGKIDLTAHLQMQDSLMSEVRVLAWVVENGVVGYQQQPEGGYDLQYVHNHILRGELLTMNGWGNVLTATDGVAELVASDLAVPVTVKQVEHCELVLVVMDTNAKQVLNVRKCSL